VCDTILQPEPARVASNVIQPFETLDAHRTEASPRYPARLVDFILGQGGMAEKQQAGLAQFLRHLQWRLSAPVGVLERLLAIDLEAGAGLARHAAFHHRSLDAIPIQAQGEALRSDPIRMELRNT